MEFHSNNPNSSYIAAYVIRCVDFRRDMTIASSRVMSRFFTRNSVKRLLRGLPYPSSRYFSGELLELDYS